jgi:hypothetical protein
MIVSNVSLAVAVAMLMVGCEPAAKRDFEIPINADLPVPPCVDAKDYDSPITADEPIVGSDSTPVLEPGGVPWNLDVRVCEVYPAATESLAVEPPWCSVSNFAAFALY